MDRVRIATRRSPLALWQAEHVAGRLRERWPALDVEIVGLTTQGDRVLDAPLAKIGGKGLFVKELERALLDGHADVAVHSTKDVPVHLPDGLVLAAFLEREDPHDAFVSNRYASLDALPEGAVVGSSSLRRQAQLRAVRPDLVVRDLRGNVQTRLAKLDAGEYDAILLAAAGLIRLGFEARIRSRLDPTLFLPAVGQGVVAVECRADDHDLRAALATLADRETTLRVTAERAFNRRLDGGCQVPLAAHATLVGHRLRLDALVASPDGATVLRDAATTTLADDTAQAAAERLGATLAEALLARGAGPLLDQARAAAQRDAVRASALADRGVLVTRPKAQAGELIAALERQGARALAFPALEIVDSANDRPLNEALDGLAGFDVAIFVSTNAVQRVVNRLRARGLDWPARLRIAAIGARTAKELAAFGLDVAIRPPRRFDSEALLEQPELADVAGQRIVIFRGDGGREHLADELARRGADVVAVESYRRVKPEADATGLMRAWSRGEVDVVFVASVETWHNLFEMVGKLGRMWLAKTPVVAGSERIAEAVRKSGHRGAVVVAQDPSDAAMIEAAAQFFDGRPPSTPA